MAFVDLHTLTINNFVTRVFGWLDVVFGRLVGSQEGGGRLNALGCSPLCQRRLPSRYMKH